MRTFKLSIVALAAILTFASLAVAANPVIPSGISITAAFVNKDGGVTVKGKVTSTDAKCIKNRRVKVWHASKPPFYLGETTTNDEGKWRLSTIYQPDKVYAKVLTEKLSNITCDKKRSRTKTVNS